MKSRIQSLLVNSFVFLLGFLSLLAPFVVPQARDAGYSSTSFPVMVSLIIILCVLILLLEAQATILNAKLIAFLGILIALNAGLRFLETAIPGPAGFSPIFFLIILTGYFFGGRVGFLMGAMTMLISGLITGGVGPWLPGQMITAGWVGQSAGILSPLFKRMRLAGKQSEIILLAIFSAIWGMLYGAIMNLWFWPFLGGAPGQTWFQGATLAENIGRYATYYLATSVIWDVTRAIGNILIVTFLARPVLNIFARFNQRFSFHILPEGEPK
ncbi:MAG: ECF transporter S component [Anaerolineaceae bacterium]|nr:ECF transporter S component [Anaerolineaceae bacterium]